MSPRLTRGDLSGAEVVWLLSVTWAGQVYRFSTRPVAPVDEDGHAIPHHGALEELVYEDSLEILSTSPELRTVAISVVFQADVAARIALGHDLSTATGELSRWVVGSAYEARHVVLVGQVVEPEYGAVDEPVAFSLEENPYDDTALIPPAAARVTVDTWDQAAVQTPEGSIGLYYPIVFGQPGVWYDEDGAQQIGRGSPCVVVDWANISGQAELVVIAGHVVEASTVHIVDQDGNAYVGTVVHQEDELGRTVATVAIPLGGTGIDSTGDLWVCWSFDRAMPGVEGAGDLLRHMLRVSSLRVDWGRVEAARPSLNRVQVAGYIDTAVSPWEWTQDNLLPMLPLSMASGPSGLFAVLWAYGAKPADAVGTLRRGPGVERTSPVTYERTKRDIVNEVRLSYAIDGEAGSLIVLTHTPTPAPADPTQVTSYHSQASASRYGIVSRSLDSDILWDRATAHRWAARLIRSQGFTGRALSYEVDDEEWGWVTPGSVLLLADDDLSIDGQVCIIRSRTYSDTGRISLGLLLLEDPARDRPGVTLGSGS